jgi:hypothetical protein
MLLVVELNKVDMFNKYRVDLVAVERELVSPSHL